MFYKYYYHPHNTPSHNLNNNWTHYNVNSLKFSTDIACSCNLVTRWCYQGSTHNGMSNMWDCCMLSRIDYVSSFYKNLMKSQCKIQPYNLCMSLKMCIQCRIMNMPDMLLVLLSLENNQFHMRSIVMSCMLHNLMHICGTCCQWNLSNIPLGNLYMHCHSCIINNLLYWLSIIYMHY